MKRSRRRLRLRLAPPGTRQADWLNQIFQTLGNARQVNLASIAVRLLPPPLREPLRNYLRQRRLAAARPLQGELSAILQEQGAGGHPEDSGSPTRRVIIFPPSLDWNTQLFQRPQQLALALARQGALVFYMQPKITSGGPGFQRLQEGLYLCNAPVEVFWDLPQPIIYLLTWNRDYARAFQSPQVIYDYVDEIQTFAGNHKQMERDHRKLVGSARLVLATAERLYRQVQPLRPDALLCPNGVEYHHFDSKTRGSGHAPPADLAPVIQQGRPVIGYYGALARWFDWPLLTWLAQNRPDLSFVLIGPDYDSTLPPDLLDLHNVFWLGVKPYRDLPGYLSLFDVAMIPFQLNEITHSTSPLKLFEYMAAGKPVVITPMHESLRTPGVLPASNPQEFSRQIDRALQLKNDPEYLAEIDAVARENTWDARARQILVALNRDYDAA